MRTIIGLSLLTLILSACLAAPGTTPPPAASPATPTPTTETPEQDSGTSSQEQPVLLPEEAPPAGAEAEFTTDFSRHSVPYSEILSGGPPKDGIPAIESPTFIPIEEADAWLGPQEPVILLKTENQVRAYPIQILMWHEIVNDRIADLPVLISYCPLCNTAIAFESRIDGQDLDFGTTGRLRYSNLIMYDRQTESWWQQATGEAIAGELTGRQLKFLPVTIVAWETFKTAHPDGTVLSKDTGHTRNYGQNPYTGYDDTNSSPFLYQGPETPETLPAMARVLTVDMNGETVAYPYEVMESARVTNDTVGNTQIVVLWEPGTASALDAGRIAEGRDVGTAMAFSRSLDGQTLTFTYNEGRILDQETGSEWNTMGRAIAGPQTDNQLEAIVGINHFWFSWAAFKPETRIYQSTSNDTSAKETPPSTPAVSLSADIEILVYQGEAMLGGEQVMFSDILAQGKPVVLQFWAGLCPFCRKEMPEIQAAYERYKDTVLVVGLDIGAFTGLGNEEDARALLKELAITFPAGTTPDITAMQAYKVTGVPTTLFFKPNGELVEQWRGVLTEKQLTDYIEALLEASN